MEHKIFHGEFSEDELAQCLMIHFNRGNLLTQKLKYEDSVGIQIMTRNNPTSGGNTALGVIFRKVADGVSVQLGKQAWMGIAASLGYTALTALRNPLNILHRLDDLAQDLEYLQMSDEVWQVLETNAKALGSGFELSKRLRTIMCDYCETANPTGIPSCSACGAPTGNNQPESCKNCGFIVSKSESICPNCRKSLK